MKLGGQIITREEELRLPTYLAFVNKKEFDFISKDNTWFSLKLLMGRIQLYKDSGYNLQMYKDFGEYSEKNYEEALQTIEKLYKGEDL